jgi:hypothetical protein
MCLLEKQTSVSVGNPYLYRDPTGTKHPVQMKYLYRYTGGTTYLRVEYYRSLQWQNRLPSRRWYGHAVFFLRQFFPSVGFPFLWVDFPSFLIPLAVFPFFSFGGSFSFVFFPSAVRFFVSFRFHCGFLQFSFIPFWILYVKRKKIHQSQVLNPRPSAK